MSAQTLTPEERAAIKALHRLAKKWPKTLWLYSAAAQLHVMRRQEGADVAVNPDAIIDTIEIPNDGGDW